MKRSVGLQELDPTDRGKTYKHLPTYRSYFVTSCSEMKQDRLVG
jgi:hypothetical protein